MGRISKRRLKRRNRNSMIWVSLIVFLLVGVFGVKSYKLYAERSTYKSEQKKLEKQLEDEKDRTADLEEEEKYRGTKKYIEDYAHNQLGLVYPGEIIFKTQK